jgi:hypothetical protein
MCRKSRRPRSNLHSKPRLGATAQQEDQKKNRNRNSEQPQKNVTGGSLFSRLLRYLHIFASLFYEDFAPESAIAPILFSCRKIRRRKYPSSESVFATNAVTMAIPMF